MAILSTNSLKICCCKTCKLDSSPRYMKALWYRSWWTLANARIRSRTTWSRSTWEKVSQLAWSSTWFPHKRASELVAEVLQEEELRQVELALTLKPMQSMKRCSRLSQGKSWWASRDHLVMSWTRKTLREMVFCPLRPLARSLQLKKSRLCSQVSFSSCLQLVTRATTAS